VNHELMERLIAAWDAIYRREGADGLAQTMRASADLSINLGLPVAFAEGTAALVDRVGAVERSLAAVAVDQTNAPTGPDTGGAP
jgi:hypothetical protein